MNGVREMGSLAAELFSRDISQQEYDKQIAWTADFARELRARERLRELAGEYPDELHKMGWRKRRVR